MAATATQPRLRQFMLYGLILLALALVSAVVFVLMNDDPVYSAEELFSTGVIVDPEKQPAFDFPEEIRSTDLSVNAFIDRFFRLCASANYPEVRLLLSQRSGESLPPNRFERMFNAMKAARIKELKAFPDPENLDEKAYVLFAEYDLEDFAAKQQKKNNPVRLLIFKENGQWRLGPASRDILARIDAYEAATSQPAEPDAGDADQNAAAAPAPPPPNVVANKPMKIEPED